MTAASTAAESTRARPGEVICQIFPSRVKAILSGVCPGRSISMAVTLSGVTLAARKVLSKYPSTEGEVLLSPVVRTMAARAPRARTTMPSRMYVVRKFMDVSTMLIRFPPCIGEGVRRGRVSSDRPHRPPLQRKGGRQKPGSSGLDPPPSLEAGGESTANGVAPQTPPPTGDASATITSNELARPLIGFSSM